MAEAANKPLITIGMPTYKRTEYLRAALEGCFAQTFSDFEIIVHDDTPDDSIRLLAESYNDPRVRYIQNKPMLGLVGKLNDFLVQAQGDWLIILCDDDNFEPEFLRELVDLANAHPSATLVRARNRLIDEHGKEMALDLAWPELLDGNDFLGRVFLPNDRNIAMNLTGVMFHPRQMRELGGFENLYRAWHVDRIAWAQLGAAGAVASSQKVLCNIRIHSSSISSGSVSDFEKALEADLTMKRLIEDLIRARSALANSAAEQQKLEVASQTFKGYMKRHMTRSMDHGLLTALGSANPASYRDLYKRMNELELPPFGTAVAYRYLRHLPLWVRRFAVAAIQRYKQHWLKPASQRRQPSA
jgi:glycosyltransferase involved in cell wall biosynthesis